MKSKEAKRNPKIPKEKKNKIFPKPNQNPKNFKKSLIINHIRSQKSEKSPENLKKSKNLKENLKNPSKNPKNPINFTKISKNPIGNPKNTRRYQKY